MNKKLQPFRLLIFFRRNLPLSDSTMHCPHTNTICCSSAEGHKTTFLCKTYVCTYEKTTSSCTVGGTCTSSAGSSKNIDGIPGVCTLARQSADLTKESDTWRTVKSLHTTQSHFSTPVGRPDEEISCKGQSCLSHEHHTGKCRPAFLLRDTSPKTAHVV